MAIDPDVEVRLAEVQAQHVAEFPHTTASFDVKDFGAVGDGVTDDVVAIQAAFDACTANVGGVVFFPDGTYRVSDTVSKRGTYTRIVGTQPRRCRIVGDAAMTTAILQITMTQDGSFFGIENIGIEGNSSSNTGQHGIEFVSSPNSTLTQGWISKCWVRLIGGTPIKLTNGEYNPANGTNIEQTLFRFDIKDNVLDASNSTADAVIDLTYCGDSVRMQRNLIRGYGIGIRLYAVLGAKLHVIRDNVITSRGGGIHIQAGVSTRIESNHIELTFNPASAPGDACIFIEGTTEISGDCENVTIIGNNIDAGKRNATGIKYNIRLDRAERTVIDTNYVLTGTIADILIGENSQFTTVGPSNMWIDDEDWNARPLGNIIDSGSGTRPGA